MSVHIIVDGYNLIRQSPFLAALDRRDLAEGRQALIDMLAAYKRLKGHAITVVFDGGGEHLLYDSRDRDRGIHIRFSRRHETADAVIKEISQKEKQKALVVSSDRQVADFAASQGSATIGAREFEEKMALAVWMSSQGMAGKPLEGDEGPVSKGKKGPARRLTKRQRQNQKKLDRL